MMLKVFLLLAASAAALAAPAKMQEAKDMIAEEGRHVSSYAAPGHYAAGSAPGHYAAASAPHYGSVTSYNRRGSYVGASDLEKPSIYGSSYGAPAGHAYNSAPKYSPDLAPPYHAQQSYGSAYGPQRNEYSAQSQLLSHDPGYDAAKDPVSQYAAYIPVMEYGPKSQSSGHELSIYGYK